MSAKMNLKSRIIAKMYQLTKAGFVKHLEAVMEYMYCCRVPMPLAL